MDEMTAALEFCSKRACSAASVSHLKWVQALASGRLGDPQRSLTYFSEALRGFEDGKETENAASVRSLTAETLEVLGSDDDAWPYRRVALQAAQRNGTLDRIYIAFNEAADAALRQGHLTSARMFQDVVVEAARRERNTVLLADALLWRARIDNAADKRGASRDLHEAETLVTKIDDPQRRARLTAGLARTRAEVSGPADASDNLTTAIAFFRTAEDHDKLAELYAARADAEEKASHRDLAEADYVRCIAELESERGTITNGPMRERYFSGSSSVFDRAIRHLWLGGRHNDAFNLAEESRGREMRGGANPPAITLSELQGGLRSGDAILEYELLDDRMIVWVVRPTGTKAIETPSTATTVASAVNELREAFDRGDKVEESLRRVAMLVYWPIAAEVKDAKRLVFVTNKSIRAVPFSALPEPATGKYLVQGHEIVVAPSAATYIAALRSDRSIPHSGPPSVLIASYTPGDPARHLPSLLHSRDEVAGVRALYSHVESLADGEATPSRILSSAARATIVHIVAHSVQNSEHPEFSSIAVAASQDGRDLYAHMIASASFRFTRLVFLSSCGTTGRTSHNDVPLTLPESFLSAGVPVVVGATRPVDDAATAAFAVAFHRAFAATGDAVAALRSAQLECLASSAWHEPRFWSTWIAIGGSA